MGYSPIDKTKTKESALTWDTITFSCHTSRFLLVSVCLQPFMLRGAELLVADYFSHCVGLSSRDSTRAHSGNDNGDKE